MTEYKETLNLPQTSFPMKANLGQREPEFLKRWEKESLYEKILLKNEKKPLYLFHDGPPYANGHIHYGTILNKILKDIVVKYKNMAGYRCPFVPGWDCHGLPIELQVDKELGPKKRKMTLMEIRKACRDYAGKFIDIQRGEFKRLGCFGDWNNPYLTMSCHYEAVIAREFGNFVSKGLVYRGKKPVYWCPSCQTALAEAEVEYDQHQAPSVYVKFRLVEEDRLRERWHLGGKEPIYLVIWTTTPWTLPANLGIALHPKLEYAALRVGGEIYVVADGLAKKFLKIIDSPKEEVVAKFQGRDLEKLHSLHPFLPRKSLIVLGDHVTLDSGTGCVHTAPGHGQEDYIIGQQYGLETLAPVDGKGCFTPEAGLPWLTGKNVEEANEPIIEHLKEKKALLKSEKITHSYPHCWRCKKPIVFRATEQWFISMEKGNLREEVLRAIHHVKWIPGWGINRITGMIKSRPDWCISRQRLWGVPIIAVICEDCGTATTNPELIENAVKVFEEEGSDSWFSLDIARILPQDFQCPQCKKKTLLKKEKDILDVWFDSGVSFAAVLEKEGKQGEPADLYLEGSDQHRGWFHTSLLTSVATRGRAPYRQVLTHGFVVDAEGKKLSKSAKNYIPPDNVLNRHGAEMLRLWVANEDYRNDIRFSEEILTRLVDSYRKIRNTCRYLLGNLFDFDPDKDSIPYGELLEIDRWALHLLKDLVQKIDHYYESFEFHMISHTLTRFCAVELSAFYFDILKDRLYTEKKDGPSRRGAQTVLFHLLNTLTRLMAPILSFTAEEVWEESPPHKAKQASIFLADLPTPHKEWEDAGLGERWERFFRMREVVTKALEMARAEKYVRNSLEARVVLEGEEDQKKFLESFGESLPDLLIVSEVVFGKAAGSFVHASENVVGFKAGIEKAKGAKCARCWKYSPTVGKDQKYSDICGRCVRVVRDAGQI